MTNKSIFSLNSDDFVNQIDDRILSYSTGWSAIEMQGTTQINIPDTWNSEFFPFRYFEVIKAPGDPNYDPTESQNEMCLSLMGGWKGYDEEIFISLWITGKAVLDKSQTKVSAEIYKHAGNPIQLFFNGTLVTDFNKIPASLSGTNDPRFVWVDDVSTI